MKRQTMTLLASLVLAPALAPALANAADSATADLDRKSTRLNSSHNVASCMPSSA